MADQTGLVEGENGENRSKMNGDDNQDVREASEFDEELDDSLFDDPEDFVDDISDEGD